MVMNAVLVFLVLVAVVLGYFVYQKITTGGTTTPLNQEVSQMPVEGVVDGSQEATTDRAAVPIPSEDPTLTADERAVLNPPASGSPEGDFQAHFALAQRTATEANMLTMSAGCRMNPVILKAQNETTVLVQNQDTVAHTIVFNGTLTYPVPAGGEVSLPIGFEKGVGLYGYACDASASAAGMILVTE